MEWCWHKSTYDHEGSVVPHYRNSVYSLNWRIIANALTDPPCGEVIKVQGLGIHP